MAKYNVSMAVDLRVDIPIEEASSFEEAFEIARLEISYVDLATAEWVGSKPVNAEREDGAFADYGYHPYPDER